MLPAVCCRNYPSVGEAEPGVRPGVWCNSNGTKQPGQTLLLFLFLHVSLSGRAIINLLADRWYGQGRRQAVPIYSFLHAALTPSVQLCVLCAAGVGLYPPECRLSGMNMGYNLAFG